MSDTYYDTKLSLLPQRQIKSPNMRNLAGKQLELRTELLLNVSSKVSKITYGFSIKTFDTGDLMNNSLSAGAVNAIHG